MQDPKNLMRDALSPVPGRRAFLELLAAGAYWAAAPLAGAGESPGATGIPAAAPRGPDIGTLYPEVMKLADLCDYPLSFLDPDNSDLTAYKHAVRDKVFELFQYSPPAASPAPEVLGRWEYPDYIQEKVLFSTTPWFRVPAYVLIPKGRTGPRPGIVDLHSHGGMFIYGKEKVMPVPGPEQPALTNYRRVNYEGRSTSHELCRRGYVVVSIDAFYFGERRTLFPGDLAKYGADRTKYTGEDVQALNHHASDGEAILACSLFWAGATWQGVVHWDDIRTVDYLLSRPEVDPNRIGCLGISLGGDRTDYLAGLDERIKCAVSVGWMSTLRPMIKTHVQTHSFLHFLPGLTHYLDLPDLLGCMAPKPLMVQECSQDELYPLEGMKEAVSKLNSIYSKAGVPAMFQGKFYDHPHIFTISMQEEAFAWLDRWLEPRT
jgi:dienelactone hydrolase